MSRVIVLLTLIAGCGSAVPPKSFGVNLTISFGSVDSATRDSVTQLLFDVSGDETFSATTDVSKLLHEDSIRVHYVPGVHSGTIDFKISALAVGGAVVAAGDSGPVDLRDGVAVSASVSLSAGEAPGDMAVQPGSKNQGDACSVSAECNTQGGCVDGVCCNTSCSDPCFTCNSAGSVGVCAPVAAGSMPTHGMCATDASSTCGHDGTCDGMGACGLYPQGTACSAGSCDSNTNTFSPPSQCDGTGSCIPLQAYNCAPYRCQGTTACFGPPCGDSSQCDSSHSCVNNSCGLLPNGRNCTQATQCQSGYCVDGVCCGSACTGQCQACDIPDTGGLLGTCSTVVTGAPHSSHAACTGAGTICAGTCNGSSATACSYPTSSCGASSCSGTTETDQFCSAGVCAPTMKMCQSGFACAGSACATMCDVATNAGCVANDFCAAGGTTCRKKVVLGSVMSSTLVVSASAVLGVDFDKDGKMDLAVNQSFDGGGVLIYLGQGNGTFVQKGAAFATGNTPYAFASADFNNDSKPDLAIVYINGASMVIALGNGDGTFSTKPAITIAAGSRGVATGDFNADGKADIVVASPGVGSVSVFLGVGDGTFTAKPSITQNAYRVTVGDLNSDGKPDFVVADSTANNVAVYLGVGDGTFTLKGTTATGTAPEHAVIGDFNGDGKPDLAVANATAATITVLTGIGDGSFQLGTTLASGASTDYLTVADFNGDSRPDIAFVNDSGSGAAGVFAGVGDGTFGPPVSVPVGSEPESMAVADFNGDTKVDIVVPNFSPAKLVFVPNATP